MAFEIEKHAMLARLRVRAWSAVITDKAVSDEVADAKGARRSAGSYRKVLVPSDALARVRDQLREVKSTFFNATMPWEDKGFRLLPVENHERLREFLHRKREDLRRVIGEFLVSYEAEIARAEERLGALFNRDDYPHPDAIREAYGIEWEFMPVPTGKHFVLKMAGERMAELQTEADAAVQRRFGAAAASLYDRLRPLVEHMIERLDGEEMVDGVSKPKKFRDSLVSNLLEAVDVVDTLNIHEDEKLREASARIRGALAGVPADELRPNSRKFDRGTRDSTLEEMRQVMAGYLS